MRFAVGEDTVPEGYHVRHRPVLEIRAEVRSQQRRYDYVDGQLRELPEGKEQVVFELVRLQTGFPGQQRRRGGSGSAKQLNEVRVFNRGERL